MRHGPRGCVRTRRLLFGREQLVVGLGVVSILVGKRLCVGERIERIERVKEFGFERVGIWLGCSVADFRSKFAVEGYG